MKLTVYIVDDEPMAIQYLETLLIGTNLDIKVIGTAPNGVKAIPEITKLHPDFVFVDISMPVMDGLKMSEEILKINPLQKIFMLTAYRDFTYAQKGISIGVAHYFLKNELSAEQLEEVIRKNASHLERERREHHQILETNLRDFFRADSFESINGWAYQDKPLQRYILFYIARRPQIVLRPCESRSSVYVDCYAIESGFHDEELKLRAFVELSGNEYCGIFFTSREVQNAEWKSRQTAKYIMDKYLKNMEDYVCFISLPVTKFDMLPNTYYRLRSNMKYVYADCRKIYMEQDLKSLRCDPHDHQIRTTLAVWKEKFAGGLQEEAGELFGKLLNEMDRTYDVWDYSDHVQDLCHFLFTQIQKNKLNAELFTVENCYTDIEILKRDLFNIQETFFREMRRRKEKQYSRHVILALEYVYRNYMNDISVSGIAEAAGISEGHLRRCFKKEMNENVVNFLTDFRLDCARKLMEEGMQSIDEIWKKIGFTSAQYFSYVFKKREGMSPRDYLKKSKS